MLEVVLEFGGGGAGDLFPGGVRGVPFREVATVGPGRRRPGDLENGVSVRGVRARDAEGLSGERERLSRGGGLLHGADSARGTQCPQDSRNAVIARSA